MRIGAAGARKSLYHPGGEVLEYSIINSPEINGLSQNVSGYLPKGECYSKSIGLFDKDPMYLREERIVYSHTAWLRKCNPRETRAIFLNIDVKSKNESLLDIINILSDKLDLKCYAIQIYVNA